MPTNHACSAGVLGKAFMLVVLCCGAAGAHWLIRPIHTTGFDAKAKAEPSGARAAPTGATGAPGSGATLPPIAVRADGGKTFHSPDLPPRDALDSGMISLAEAKAILDAGTAQWIDARTPEDYAQDRIGEAYHIAPDDWLGGQIPEVTHALSRDMPVVVYCGGGNCDASKLVAVRLRGIGFKDVKVFEEGWKGWTAAKMPTAMHPEGAPGGGQ